MDEVIARLELKPGDTVADLGAGTGPFVAPFAKAVPSERKVMAFMGGQPLGVYLDRGFEVLSSWIDPQLRDVVRTRSIVPADAESEVAARVSCCVKWL